MADARNYPQERKELEPVDKAVLLVWLNGEGDMSRAANELLHSRFWLDQMEGDIWRGDQLVAKALKNHQATLGLIGEIHKALEETRNSGKTLDPDYWITKIKAVMRPTLQPDEGEAVEEDDAKVR